MKIPYGRAAIVVAPGSLFVTGHDKEVAPMKITDPLTVQVADLHGITRDMQSA
ncbi:MAG TPA: hypothetical protein VFM91_00595 [Propionibacteriaceae bacterium]|nr:hypothetical protein [Propionibacteriaceae bacterium]